MSSPGPIWILNDDKDLRLRPIFIADCGAAGHRGPSGLINPSDSSWSFPVVIATKEDGKRRFCVDYRTLHQRINPSRWPIPHIEEILDEVKGSHIFSTLYLFQRYWEVNMADACKEHTTFVTRFGAFSFAVMSFDLIDAPGTFQKMMEHLLKDLPFARA